MKYLDALLRFFDQNDFRNREDVAILISEIFERNPDMSLEDFKKSVSEIRRDFFRINRLNREKFSENIYLILNRTRMERPEEARSFDLAQSFISKHIQIGFDDAKFVEERNRVLETFETIKKPHEVLLKAFNQVLDRMQISYKIDLHGVKEYSGIDICNDYRGSSIGFQIKSRNDDISEHMIRSESSKAQEYRIDGFVLIYGRKRDKTVDTSIQAAYHHFRILNDSNRMYCAIVDPYLFAELIRRYSIIV